MRRILPAIVGIFLVFFVFSVFLFHSKTTNVSAATATHLVISEVQVDGASTSNDFIELYNPTSSEISLDGLRLGKRSSTGTTSASVVAFASSDTVPAHGYFLWCNTSINAALTCDRNTSSTVANNNSVALINGALNGGTIVDAVTFGTVANPLGEGTSLTAPVASSSVERKANSSSDATSMGPGGSDEFAGNGEDTDNNASDFVSRVSSQPQNSQSAFEPAGVTPSVSPTATPSPTSSVTPTPSPTPSPTLTPTPTLSPAPTAVPSVSPTPTQTPNVIFNSPHLTCTLNYRFIKFFNLRIPVPFVRCFRV